MSTINFRDPKDLASEYEIIAKGLGIDKSELYSDALEYYLNSLPDICTIDAINNVKADSLKRKLDKYNCFEIHGCEFRYETVKVSFGKENKSEVVSYTSDKPTFRMELTEVGEPEENIVSIEGYSNDKLCFRASIPLEDVNSIKFK